MIYFADEDVIQLEPFKIELEILGYEVSVLRDADEAYGVLSQSGDDLQLAVIDVMLATDLDPDESRFDRSKTHDFLRTGLCLLEDLIVANPQNFPRRALLFSTATSTDLVRAIKNLAELHGVAYLDKNEFVNSFEFASKVDEVVRSMIPEVEGD